MFLLVTLHKKREKKRLKRRIFLEIFNEEMFSFMGTRYYVFTHSLWTGRMSISLSISENHSFFIYVMIWVITVKGFIKRKQISPVLIFPASIS